MAQSQTDLGEQSRIGDKTIAKRLTQHRDSRVDCVVVT